MSIRKGDVVKIITGKDKGKTGKVLSVDRCEGKILVQGINMVKRHQKPTQKQRQGGVVEKEAYLSISNVMFYDEKFGNATKLGHKTLDDGKKVRFSKKSGEVIETK
jgi:large subunit ribosomal protein L24